MAPAYVLRDLKLEAEEQTRVLKNFIANVSNSIGLSKEHASDAFLQRLGQSIGVEIRDVLVGKEMQDSLVMFSAVMRETHERSKVLHEKQVASQEEVQVVATNIKDMMQAGNDLAERLENVSARMNELLEHFLGQREKHKQIWIPSNLMMCLIQTIRFALSTGDLMAALLLIFVLLLTATLLIIRENEAQTRSIVTAYEELQDSLYQDLLVEFEGDLNLWSADLDRETLSIRFFEPQVLFEQGQSTVRPLFAQILSDFFPRYISILQQERYRNNIEEIRIEGHTSSEWGQGLSEEVSYFNNMELSQNRTRSVLQYVLTTLDTDQRREWARSRITANGLSSSQPILINGVEDPLASRRVEFRVRTDAERQLNEILSGLNGRTP